MPQSSKHHPISGSPHGPSIGDLARNALLFDGLTADPRSLSSKPRPSNLTDLIAATAVRRIDQELDEYHRHMVIFEREGVDEDDDDDDDDTDTVRKEKLSSQSCSLGTKPGRQLKSCPTGTLSSIQQMESSEFKSAADQLFSVRGPLESQVASGT